MLTIYIVREDLLLGKKKITGVVLLFLSFALFFAAIKFGIFSKEKQATMIVDKKSVEKLIDKSKENSQEYDKQGDEFHDKKKVQEDFKEKRLGEDKEKSHLNIMSDFKVIEGERLSPISEDSSFPEKGKENPDKPVAIDKEKELEKSVNLFFVIKDKTLLALTKEGSEEVAKRGRISVPEGVVTIGEGAFKGRRLKEINFPSTLKFIERDAFYDNDLKELTLPTGLEIIERGAFDKNNLDQVVLTNPKCSIDGIFYNDKYVNIITANKEIKDQTWKESDIDYHREDLKDRKAYGSLVNRASVKVVYYDERENKEFEYNLVSRDRNNRFERKTDDLNKYFKLGEEINVVALKNDYLHLGNVRIKGKIDSKVDFHYKDRAKEEVEVIDYSKPQINGARQAMLISVKDLDVDFKKDIFATDAYMNDISSNVEVLNVDEIKLGQEGEYSIRYRVKDSEGNVAEAERRLYIEEEKKWYGHDFYYDQDVLVGLSRIGELKFNEFLLAKEDKLVSLPAYSDRGIKLTKVGAAAFAGLRFREVKIPQGYEVIRKMAFDSTLLEKVSLPDSIKEVEERAFAFTNIEFLKLPKDLENVGKRAFACINIKDLVLPEKIRRIEEAAFINNSKLKISELTIPASVKFIGISAFENCKLSKLILNEGLEEIGDAAFAKNNLREVVLPNSLKILAPGAFKQNGMGVGTNFHTVKLFTKDGKNPNNFVSNVFQVINPKDDEEDLNKPFNEKDFVLEEGGLKLSAIGKKKIKVNKELIIPDSILGIKVEKIAGLSFMSKNLRKISLPEGLKEIGESAFIYNSIEELSLPDEIKVIRNSSFFENAKLKELKLPKKLEKIEANAFMNSSLSRVELPDTIKLIENNAFKKKTGRVTLVINYNPETKAFIDENKKRTDFILEVAGQEQTAFNISLKNKLTKFGIKLGDTIEFAIDGAKEKPKLRINGSEVKYTYMNNTAMISPLRYKDLLESDGILNVEFEYGGEKKSDKVKVFEPDTVKLVDPDKKYAKEEMLTFELANSKYPYEGISVYENKYSTRAMKNVTISGNMVTVKFEEKPKDSSMIIYIAGDYHIKTEVKINFLEDEKGVVFTTIGQEKDTVIYESSKIDGDIYSKLKESFEEDKVVIKAGRTEYSKGLGENLLEDSQYYIDFNDEGHTIKLYINKPVEWENLEINFSDISWNYYFDGKNIAKE